MHARVLLLVLCLTPIATAQAQPGDLKEQSRAHFRVGTPLYEAGKYAQGGAELEEAYRLLPLPDLLFNLGQANRRAGHRDRAIAYYQRFLENTPSGSRSDEARDLLSGMGAPVTSGKSADDYPSFTKPAPTPAPASPTVAVVPTPTIVQAPAPTAPPAPRGKAWIAAVVVPAVVVLGVIIGVSVAYSVRNDASSTGPTYSVHF